MVDNSRSMADKQELLRLALPDLIENLLSPPCLGPGGATQRPGEGGQCPAGWQRAFFPMEDINIAVITSSLGDAGAEASCPTRGHIGYIPDQVDMAHTLGSLPRGQHLEASEMGFLEWRGGSEVEAFVAKFQAMVESVGERGCGFEAPLESWYRFLVEPKPYRALERVACSDRDPIHGCVAPARGPEGEVLLDEELLAQRRAFLRPDSLLAVVMLSDENDCSMRVGKQMWVVSNTNDTRPMFRASSACEENPNDPCCYTCVLGAPPECPPDPVCQQGAGDGRLSEAEDAGNLRCFDQKRRFGTDFLYPVERYVNALRSEKLCSSSPDLGLEGCPRADVVPNPLFPEGGRAESLVYLGGILGVPWQLLEAREAPDGSALPDGVLRYKSWAELSRDGDWDVIVGDPGREGGRAPTPPSSPFMVESAVERTGIEVNPINGREYDTSQSLGEEGPPHRDDLQFACIFPLAEPRECGAGEIAEGVVCDCFDGDNDRPVCEEQPGVTPPTTTQHWAKAYPGARQLQVLRGLGKNSVVASICARNVQDATRQDFGYRPAVSSLVKEWAWSMEGLPPVVSTGR